mmetsp:Transcript_52915/g.87962  ORF Transcript_52915/g.87962 Transcript_52915/m.87962 type:complete len:227 (+) Transcript_52915:382-1062(+)
MALTERDAARRLGVMNVLVANHDRDLLHSVEYASFLQKIIESTVEIKDFGENNTEPEEKVGEEEEEESMDLREKSERQSNSGAVESTGLQQLQVNVVPASTLDASEGFSIDPLQGVLKVPVNATPDQVAEYLQKNGFTLARTFGKLKAKIERVFHLMNKARARLRLSGLTYDSNAVNVDQAHSCCLRLIKAVPRLQPVLQEHSVVISDHYGVTVDGKLKVKWDFDL